MPRQQQKCSLFCSAKVPLDDLKYNFEQIIQSYLNKTDCNIQTLFTIIDSFIEQDINKI